MAEVLVGKVTDYFAKIGVAALIIENGELSLGDTIHFVGHTTDFEQKINSMQIELPKSPLLYNSDTCKH